MSLARWRSRAGRSLATLGLALALLLAAGSLRAAAQRPRLVHGERRTHSSLTEEERARLRERQLEGQRHWEGHCREVGQVQCVAESAWALYSILPLWAWLSIALGIGVIAQATRKNRLRVHHRSVDPDENVDVTAIELAIHASDAERLRAQVAALLAKGRAATLHTEVAELLLASRARWTLVAVRHWNAAPSTVAQERQRALVAEIKEREEAELPRVALGYRGDAPAARGEDPEVSLISFIVATRVEIPTPPGRGATVAEETLRTLAKVGAKDAVDVGIHFTPAAPGDAMRASEMLTRAPRLSKC